MKLPAEACERLKEVKLAVREVRNGNGGVTASAVDPLCTHGPDPAPPGVDPKTPRRLGVDPPLASLPIPIPAPGAPAGNANNGPPGIPGSVARIDSGCWGLASRGQSVEAHELMHSLGAVMRSAPNASAAGHCTDDSDRMCYQDGTVAALRSLCAPSQENLFDCADDDYFHTAPGSGSYLATHWDAAN